MFVKPLKRIWFALIIVIDIILVGTIVIITVLNFSGSQQKIKDKSIEELISLNGSSGYITYEFLLNYQKSVDNIMKYLSSDNFTYNDAVNFLKSYNSDSRITIQLVSSETQTGHAFFADGTTRQLDYSSYDEMISEFTDGLTDHNNLKVIGQFTDNSSGSNAIAVHTHLMLTGESDPQLQNQVIMIVIKNSSLDNEKIWADKYNENNNVVSVLMNDQGDIIIGDNHVSTNNLFTYLNKMNYLTLSQINEIKMIFKDKDNNSGYLSFDSEQGTYLYAYLLVEESMNWYMVSYAPEDDILLDDNNQTEQSIIIIIVGFFLLLAFNMLWLFVLNRNLKNNVNSLSIANNAKTDFLSRMSHDMRTPMNGILGLSELGLKSHDEQELHDYLSNINKSGKYLLSLINDTLDMNKIESGKMILNHNTVHLEDYLNEIFVLFTASITEKDLEFKTNKMGDFNYYVSLDEVRVKQIFTNILSNAFKFTKNGGNITVNLTSKVDEKTLHLGVTIQDSGIGMTEEYLQHIYEPFSQESNETVKNLTGTGLGMSIVKNLIDSMQGQIYIDSKLNVGTNVTIRLKFPIIEENRQKKENVNLDILKGKRVLLAEDHPMNVLIVNKLLENVGVIVETAENGVETIKILTEKPEDYYDLILMDVRMPVMDGLIATQEIRKINSVYTKNIPIIAMTANAFASDIKDCLDAGMNDHLGKPVDTKILYLTLYKYLSK